MNNASAQVVGYVGSSICNLFKLAPYLSEQGYDVQALMTTVMGELNGQLDHRSPVSGMKDMSASADIGRQSGGVTQNSGFERQ